MRPFTDRLFTAKPIRYVVDTVQLGGDLVRTWMAVAGGVLFAVTPVSAADIAGHYRVAGKSPSGGSYSGTVDVTRTADKIYDVVWTIGSKKSVGTGIGDGSYVAVGYKNSDSFGICLVALKGGSEAEAVWTYSNGKSLGIENWTRD